jgi:purine-binding chemotaxis protein CheW
MATTEELDAVLVPVGSDLYAVPIGWVREVVSVPRLTRLVTAPSAVLGLFNLRGEIVPLLDTAALLGVGRSEALFVVVLQTQLGPVGLSVTAFPQRAMLATALGPSELAATLGSFRVGDQVAVLLDVEAVLAAATPPAAELVDAADSGGSSLHESSLGRRS